MRQSDRDRHTYEHRDRQRDGYTSYVTETSPPAAVALLKLRLKKVIIQAYVEHQPREMPTLSHAAARTEFG